MSNSNVVVAEAIWNKTREHDFITVLDHTHIAPIPTTATNSALASYQNSILSSGNGDVPSKFVRTKKEKRKDKGNNSSASVRFADPNSTIVDNNTSQGAAAEGESLLSFAAPPTAASRSSSGSSSGAKSYDSDDNVPI